MDKLTIISEEFQNEQTGENVPGITIIVDGKLKQVMDVLINKSGDNTTYAELVKNALILGINEMIREAK